jgi:hypothetical protein
MTFGAIPLVIISEKRFNAPSIPQQPLRWHDSRPSGLTTGPKLFIILPSSKPNKLLGERPPVATRIFIQRVVGNTEHLRFYSPISGQIDRRTKVSFEALMITNMSVEALLIESLWIERIFDLKS